MPRLAVQQAFLFRGVEHSRVHLLDRFTPYQIILASGIQHWFTTCVAALRLLSDFHAAALLKVSPRKAQAQALGWESQHTIWVVDHRWTGRAVDVEVGDLVFVQGQAIL